jgi:hypothetical protein
MVVRATSRQWAAAVSDALEAPWLRLGLSPAMLVTIATAGRCGTVSKMTETECGRAAGQNGVGLFLAQLQGQVARRSQPRHDRSPCKLRAVPRSSCSPRP